MPQWLNPTHPIVMGVYVVIAGMVGGGVRSVVQGVHYRRVEVGGIIHLSIFGNIFIGAVSAFVVWASGLTNPELLPTLAVAITTGFAGVQVLDTSAKLQTATASISEQADQLVRFIDTMDSSEKRDG